ncbi:hypothetical protein BaRGS_00002743, partial [Batillaria attramentaria]
RQKRSRIECPTSDSSLTIVQRCKRSPRTPIQTGVWDGTDMAIREQNLHRVAIPPSFICVSVTICIFEFGRQGLVPWK